MRYAERGYNLEIDLSRGGIERVETDPRLMELYLGGQGTAAKLLWDRVPPEAEPFSPENLLIFSSGLFNGTPVPAATRTSVNTFSPQTSLMAHSLMGSYFGVEMKHAGYDKIVIRGKSPDLVYLWINNGKVEIRDASHLRGKVMQPFLETHQSQTFSRIERMFRDLCDERRVFQRREAWNQIVKLEYKAHVLAAITCQFRRAGLREVVIQIPDLAGGGNIEAAEDIEQGGLTAPRWSEQDHKFTRKEVEIHAAQRMDFHVSHTVGLGDPPNVKDWVGMTCPIWLPRQIPFG